MTFMATWFAPWVLWLGGVMAVLVWAMSVRTAVSSLQHTARLPVAVGLFALLWLLNVRVDAGQLMGMSYHLLGINLITLMLGAPAAMWLMGAGLLLFGVAQQGWTFASVFALNAVCIVLPACALNAAVRHWLLCRLPRNVFVYIFCGGFLSGAAGMMLTGALVCGVLQVAQVLPSHVIWTQAFPIFFLLSWGEAFLSGIGAAVCVAFKPEQLATFDDAIYLRTPVKQIWTDE